MTTPAGWFPDPAPEATGERYWDGEKWSDQTREVPAAAAPGRLKGMASAATANLINKGSFPADAVWSETGKPVTGIGAGRYWMDRTYLYFEKGTLRTDSQQVPISQVLDVDVNQTMTQKARGVFTVSVRIHRGPQPEIVVMEDIVNGREAQRAINDAAHAARAAITARQNTSTVQYVGGVPVAAPAAPVPAESAVDPITQLERLGKLRDAGVLTDAEFETQKANILSRM